ncbi:unnamed protein product [Protopolystoma xenopodis]|uniref:Uncharacterized protein n=1 Tax=Protopolystoma xenopodis TaxID=117903 RepID=A0A448XLD1_9PLAT|nr:unnamed protein product [Protopolystoma xenopodis]
MFVFVCSVSFSIGHSVWRFVEPTTDGNESCEVNCDVFILLAILYRKLPSALFMPTFRPHSGSITKILLSSLHRCVFTSSQDSRVAKLCCGLFASDLLFPLERNIGLMWLAEQIGLRQTLLSLTGNASRQGVVCDVGPMSHYTCHKDRITAMVMNRHQSLLITGKWTGLMVFHRLFRYQGLLSLFIWHFNMSAVKFHCG